MNDRARRDARWQPISTFVIASLDAHRRATLPFGERFLLPCAKQRQFAEWRGHLLAYEASRRSPRRKAHYDDEVTFAVRSARALVDVVVPFMDEHLPPSYKREQYETWRARLLEHWEHRAKRVRACTVEGCERPRRAHGLCRRHLHVHRGE